MSPRSSARGHRRLPRAGNVSALLVAAVALTSSLALAQEPEPEEPAPAPDAPGEDAPTGDAPGEEAPAEAVFDADAPSEEAAEPAPPPTSVPPTAAPAPPPAGMAAAGSETTSMEIGSDSIPARQRPNDYSSQHFAFELRFGPYHANVDDSPGLTGTPFEDFFGDKARVMMGFEFDWQVWRAPHVGTIGVGLGWGYTQMSGPNRVPDDQPPQQSAGPVAQESSLNIMPFYAVAVGRIDVFSREFHVPLVPYGKFGFSYARWWVKDGTGLADNQQVPGGEGEPPLKEGKGPSKGTQAALGIMLQLDWLERSAAVTLDNEASINNSYLFFEWSASNYPGEQMNVGSSNWVTGLAIEM